MSKPYAEMLSLSNASRAKARDIRGFMHVVADCFSPLDVILRKCRLSFTKACRRRIYAFRSRVTQLTSRVGCHPELRSRFAKQNGTQRRIYAFRKSHGQSPTVWVGHSFSCAAKLHLPTPRAEQLAREEFRRPALNHRCHPEKAQAFVHESLPTKDLCIPHASKARLTPKLAKDSYQGTALAVPPSPTSSSLHHAPLRNPDIIPAGVLHQVHHFVCLADDVMWSLRVVRKSGDTHRGADVQV